MQSTSRHYTEAINPHLRAERDAHRRGYNLGLLHAALFVIALCFFAAVAT